MPAVQEIHQRIPAFKQMLYGKAKAPYVKTSLLSAKKKQDLIQQLKSYKNPQEYLKFTSDIRLYDFKQAVPIRYLNRISEIDFDEVVNDFDTFSYVYYDILGSDILVYLVQWKDKKYLCFYNYSRYFQTIQHPKSKLVFCIAYK
jgi:hypothetical protein